MAHYTHTLQKQWPHQNLVRLVLSKSIELLGDPLKLESTIKVLGDTGKMVN